MQLWSTYRRILLSVFLPMTERGAAMSMQNPGRSGVEFSCDRCTLEQSNICGGSSDTYETLNASFENSAAI